MSETLLLPDVDNRSSLSLSILIGSPCAPERLKITAGHDTVSSAKWPVFFSPGSFAYYFARVRANLGWGVSEIKATNLVNIIGGFLKKKWLGLGVIRTIVC